MVALTPNNFPWFYVKNDCLLWLDERSDDSVAIL